MMQGPGQRDRSKTALPGGLGGDHAASAAHDVEASNDRLAREYPIDDYYARAPLPVRLVERRRLAIIRAFAGDVRGKDLAEVGAGGGHVLRMFPGARLTAIDVSSVYLETARRNLAGYDARFIKGEVDKLGLPAGSFDRVICTEVLEHTVDPAAILAAIARLLRPDGVAIVTVPNDPLILRLKSVVRRSPLSWALGDRVRWGGDEFHIHRWTPPEFERLLERFLRVTDRRAAPFAALPIRACFRCVAS
jgi:2-polyprenyl-3-methyl-5-hydroxy-6-metoxy-1,4-benzoquinol methylase